MFDWDFIEVGDGADEIALPSLFDICATAHDNLSSLPSDPEDAQTILNKLQELLSACARRIDAAGVISRNEELDDVATDSLR
jgi:hypothetical protein